MEAGFVTSKKQTTATSRPTSFTLAVISV